MKKIFTFAIALVCALAVNADPTISLSGAQKSQSDVVLTAGQETKVYVYATGVSSFIAFEANLFLPEGVEITAAKKGSLTVDDEGDPTHSFEFSNKGAEGWKLLVYNASRKGFNDDAGSIMSLTLKAAANFKGGAAQFKGVILTDPKTTFEEFPAFTIAETTGIEEVNADNSNAPIYNLQGVRVNKAENGVFIQGGKKFVVK